MTETPKLRLNKQALFRDIGYTPHPGQLEVHESTAPRRILSCGVRWGKSLCAAAEAIAAAMEPKERSIGWVVAPTYDLCDRVFREIVIVIAEHLRHRIVTLKESDKRLVVRNMAGGLSEIRGKSADNPISLLGEGLNWLIIDEASRLKPIIWESYLSQRLIDKHGWALFISTPKGKGWFYEAFRRGQGGDSDYASWNCPSWTNPYLDKTLIDNERTRLPERVFRQEFGAEFIEGSGSVFRNIRECATGDWQKVNRNLEYVAGLDLARVSDYTVMVVMNERREVVFVDRYTKLDWNLQLNRIKRVADHFQASILVDSTGMGEPIYEALIMKDLGVQPYILTQRSKAALIDNLAILLERKKIRLPKPELWPVGIDELESFQYSITDSGSVRSGAPSGVHDDCVIALGLAAWQLRPGNAPNMWFAVGTPGFEKLVRVSGDEEDD